MITYADAPARVDADYHCRRGEEELQIAQSAECAVSRRFHYHLAALHFDRAYSGARAAEQDNLRRVA